MPPIYLNEYTLNVNLPADGNRTIISMPLRAEAPKDAPFMFNGKRTGRKFIQKLRSQDMLHLMAMEQPVLPDDDFASQPEGCRSPYQNRQSRRLNRKNCYFFWYSSQGSTPLDKPPYTDVKHPLHTIFKHTNHVTGTHQYWCIKIEENNPAEWEFIVFGASRKFRNDAYFFAPNQNGDPSWVNHETLQRRIRDASGPRKLSGKRTPAQ